MRLNDVLHVAGQIPDDLVEDDPGALQCTLLIWTF